ncbi:MAG: site-specific integrase [Bifidobacteriaceae bacterium]|nr:site-specific integrase [Bifidobacteriaceae bacterium]
MASIESYETKKGTRYAVRYRKPDHTSTYKRGFRLKRDAADWAAKYVTTALSEGTFVNPSDGKITVGEYGGKWVKSKKPIWKPSTWRSNEAAWRNHVEPKWGKRSLSSIKHSEVQEWVSEQAKDKSATVVKRNYGLLKGIIESAIDDQRIKVNPTERIAQPKKVKKAHKYLTIEQVLMLAGTVDESRRAIILTICFCGLRWGELSALRVENVLVEKRRLRIVENLTVSDAGRDTVTPKSDKYRDVPVALIALNALVKQCERKAPGDLVFTDPSGKPLRPQSVGPSAKGWYKHALKEAGLPLLPPHDLRHTAASIAVSSGANVKQIQLMFGHESAAMTLDTYADLFNSDLDEVANDIDKKVEKIKCAQNVLKNEFRSV